MTEARAAHTFAACGSVVFSLSTTATKRGSQRIGSSTGSVIGAAKPSGSAASFPR
jgi:hypothetical protein